VFGDKSQVELTGAGGGPIQSNVVMTPAKAHRRMLGGDA